MVEKDRRRFQRMKLGKPLLAMMDGQSALILDIGLTGAFLEHYGAAMTADRFTLSFRWKGDEIKFGCEVRRTNVIRPAEGSEGTVSHSAVQFTETFGDATAKLTDMMGTFVGRMLAAQKANASAEAGQSGAMLFQMGDARRARARGYVAYLFDGKDWLIRPTQLAQQPRNGFTVAAYEDEDDLETLCRAYEAADAQARDMIRLVAELSVSSTKR